MNILEIVQVQKKNERKNFDCAQKKLDEDLKKPYIKIT